MKKIILILLVVALSLCVSPVLAADGCPCDPCDPCCTCECYSPGYWKTHSRNGPAPYDDTWEAIGGAGTTFYHSGQSYYEVLWTPPRGNPYYILAKQFITAQLNVENGCNPYCAATLNAIEARFNNPLVTPEHLRTCSICREDFREWISYFEDFE
jgi:hypothetical protein